MATSPPAWAMASAAERLSAAGPAPPPPVRAVASGVDGEEGTHRAGVLFNPKNYSWSTAACNVHWSEEARLRGLQKRVVRQLCG